MRTRRWSWRWDLLQLRLWNSTCKCNSSAHWSFACRWWISNQQPPERRRRSGRSCRCWTCRREQLDGGPLHILSWSNQRWIVPWVTNDPYEWSKSLHRSDCWGNRKCSPASTCRSRIDPDWVGYRRLRTSRKAEEVPDPTRRTIRVFPIRAAPGRRIRLVPGLRAAGIGSCYAKPADRRMDRRWSNW